MWVGRFGRSLFAKPSRAAASDLGKNGTRPVKTYFRGGDWIGQNSGCGHYLRHTSTMTIAKEKTSAAFPGDGKSPPAHRIQRQIWLGADVENMPVRPNSMMYGQPESSTMIFGYTGVNVALIRDFGRLRTPPRSP